MLGTIHTMARQLGATAAFRGHRPHLDVYHPVLGAFRAEPRRLDTSYTIYQSLGGTTVGAHLGLDVHQFQSRTPLKPKQRNVGETVGETVMIGQ